MSQDPKTLKLYAAFRSGCLGENVLDVYFSFLANILIEDDISVVKAADLCDRFEQRYNFSVPLTFIRQVLAVGMSNGSIVDVKGQYQVVVEKLREFKVDINSFESAWQKLLDGFETFCDVNDYDFDFSNIENDVLDFISSYDVGLVLNHDVYSDENAAPFDYAWNKYLQHISVNEKSLFNFMTEICFSNILKQAIFYSEPVDAGFNKLCVYLDSPLVFAVLGMDDKERVESVRFLVQEMKNIGCCVQVLDHNLNEVKGIITNAGGWALSTNYDIAKASKAARFFHDGQYDRESITEFCADIESLLSEYGVTIKETSFDVFENLFQEDETLLYQMVQDKYKASGYSLPSEKEYSIKVDVRSIVMLYRIRQGVIAQTIQDSRHIMITQNSAIANVCRNYESNKSNKSGHIPVCVSADLFGTVLWMYNPAKMLEYHRKQLLADCFSILKPSKKMLEKYVESLTSAKRAGEIDEKKFLFLRSHPVVEDALMNITKGDYARFDDRTYLEVFDEIVACSERKFSDEVASHALTKRQLDDETAAKNDALRELRDSKAREQASFDKSCKVWSVFWSVLIFGIPYIVILVISELLIGEMQGFSFPVFLGISAILVIGILLETLVKPFIYSRVSTRVRKYKEKRGRPRQE